MPELPDVTVYVERLRALVQGTRLEGLRIANPFLLRTVEPSVESAVGCRVADVRRLAKRIVIELEEGPTLVLHLMIAGRLQWRAAGAALPKGRGLAAFDFEPGTVTLTEAGRKRRASLHIVDGPQAVAAFDRGGIEVGEATLAEFEGAIRAENHTVKRALTDQRILSGIGNAYSDEILHAARLSPFKQTRSLEPREVEQLYEATREVLRRWTEALREDTGDGFPGKVTAFRDGMAVHGRFGKPCPVCQAPVQRIVYAENESNYCAACQTGGRIMADRSLSRLLKANWPRRLEDLES